MLKCIFHWWELISTPFHLCIAKCVHTTLTPSIHTPKINCQQKRHHSHKTITHILTRNTHRYIFNLTKPQKKGPHDVIKPLNEKYKKKRDVQKPKLRCGLPSRVVDQHFFFPFFYAIFMLLFLIFLDSLLCLVSLQHSDCFFHLGLQGFVVLQHVKKF